MPDRRGLIPLAAAGLNFGGIALDLFSKIRRTVLLDFQFERGEGQERETLVISMRFLSAVGVHDAGRVNPDKQSGRRVARLFPANAVVFHFILLGRGAIPRCD